MVKEHLRVEVDKWGKLEPSNEKVSSVNTENNLSLIEHKKISKNKSKDKETDIVINEKRPLD